MFSTCPPRLLFRTAMEGGAIMAATGRPTPYPPRLSKRSSFFGEALAACAVAFAGVVIVVIYCLAMGTDEAHAFRLAAPTRSARIVRIVVDRIVAHWVSPTSRRYARQDRRSGDPREGASPDL
jgi:hypothetical protein